MRSERRLGAWAARGPVVGWGRRPDVPRCGQSGADGQVSAGHRTPTTSLGASHGLRSDSMKLSILSAIGTLGAALLLLETLLSHTRLLRLP